MKQPRPLPVGAAPPQLEVMTGLPELEAALRERYVIDRELGRRGMTTVHLARDCKHDRLVVRPDPAPG